MNLQAIKNILKAPQPIRQKALTITLNLVLILVLFSTIPLLSCQSSSPAFAAAKSDKSRLEGSNISQEDIEKLVADNTQFACNLYHQLSDGDDNLFLSPYSISLALAMTYAGAKGETESQMAEVLHFTLSQDLLHSVFNALDLELNNRDEGNDSFQLDIANTTWGRINSEFLSSFLDTLAQNYGAGLNLLDFRNEPEKSRQIINQWVSDQTNGKIKDLIPQNSIGTATRLVLTNAIYFNAAWKYQFPEENTEDGTFNLLDGSTISTPMMLLSESDYGPEEEIPEFNYADGDGYKAVEMLYEGGELSMVILLPDKGNYKEFESNLNADMVSNILDNLEEKELSRITMPKFSYTSESISLKDALSDMGMPIAFTGGSADFSGIDGSRYLYIGDVIHKTFISVNEAGTEAAASTAVIMEALGIDIDTVDITLDHPFIYMIRDIETDTILFIGRMMNPAE